MPFGSNTESKTGFGTGGQSSGSRNNLDAGSGIGGSPGGWGSGTGTETGSNTGSNTGSSKGGGSPTGDGYVDGGVVVATPQAAAPRPQIATETSERTGVFGRIGSAMRRSGNMPATKPAATSSAKRTQKHDAESEQEEQRRAGQIPEEEESQKKKRDAQNQLSDAQNVRTSRRSSRGSSRRSQRGFRERTAQQEAQRQAQPRPMPVIRQQPHPSQQQAQQARPAQQIQQVPSAPAAASPRAPHQQQQQQQTQAPRTLLQAGQIGEPDVESIAQEAEQTPEFSMPQASPPTFSLDPAALGSLVPSSYEEAIDAFADAVWVEPEVEPEDSREAPPEYERNVPEKIAADKAAQRARDLQKSDYDAIEYNKEYFDMPLPIKNCRWNAKEDKWEFSEDIEASLNIIGGLYGLDPHFHEDFITISNLIRLSTGLGVDMKGKILGKKWNKFVMRESSVKQACLLITASQKMHGHPFGLTPANVTVMWGGSNRYPVGCIDMQMAEALTSHPNSCLHSMSAASLQIEAQKAWKNSVQPTLSEHCMRAGGDAMFEQWASIEHMIMAMCERSGMNSNNWNVSPYPERRLSSLAGANNGFPDFVEDGDAVSVGADRMERMARGTSNYRAKQTDLEHRPDAVKTADFLFSKGGSIIRGMRILFEVPLLASAEVEHFINIAEVNLIDHIIYGSTKNAGKDFKPTKEMYKVAESNAFLETFAALTALRDAGGWDAVEAFRASGRPATKENIKAWSAENSYSYKPQSKIGQEFSNLADAFDKAFEMWMPGDFGFAKADAKLFVNCLMAEQARRDGVNAKDMERLMKASPSQFLIDVFGTTVGKDAYVSTKALYAGRISPLPELLKSKLKRNGFTDFAVASVMQSWYVQYGLKAFELWVPFSNTISLAVAKNMAKRGVDGSIDWKETAVGGSSETFSKAILYDCVKLGQNTLQTLFLAALIGLCGGLQPPEDDEGEIDMDKFYLPWEWTIQFPWMDQRVPVKQNWWTDDILQGSAIGAVALCFAKQAETASYPIDDRFAAAGRMWWNGINDVMGNNQVFEVGSIIFDLFGCGMDIANYVNSEDKQLGDHISNLIDNVAGVTSPETWVGWAAKALNSSTPMVITDIYPWFWSDDYARNVYENLPDENGEVTEKTAKQVAWNTYALNNPFVAKIGNLISPETFGRKYSNYQYRSDPTADAYAHNNSYEQYCEKWDLKDSDDAKGAYAEWLLGRIQEVGGAEKALENGILVSYGDYEIVRDYLNDQVHDVTDKISEVNNDYYEDKISKDDLFKKRDHYYSMYYDLKAQLKAFEYNDLVYDKDAYIEVAGTYIQNPETGEWYNYGDKKGDNLFLPIYHPQTKTPGKDYMEGHWGTEIGNDFQTNSYLDSSDSSPSMLTSGARNLVANKDNRNIKSLMDETKSITDKWDEAIEALKEQAKDLDKKKNGGGYGGRSYSRSYRGGGGGGYSPKIYSNPARMNASKPATMYSKTPYSTSKRYLNPTVYTSGSRSPYSRRDG